MNGFLNIPRKVIMNYSALEEKRRYGLGKAVKSRGEKSETLTDSWLLKK